MYKLILIVSILLFILGIQYIFIPLSSYKIAGIILIAINAINIENSISRLIDNYNNN